MSDVSDSDMLPGYTPPEVTHRVTHPRGAKGTREGGVKRGGGRRGGLRGRFEGEV